MDGLQSREVDAILKILKDDTIWKAMVEWDGMNKIMPAPGVGLPIMPGVGPAPGVGLPIMPGVGPAPLRLLAPEQVSPDDPQAIEAAKWAVAENKRKYVRLHVGLNLKWKLVVGTIYALIIANWDGKDEYTSGAAVIELAKTGTRILRVWKDNLAN